MWTSERRGLEKNAIFKDGEFQFYMDALPSMVQQVVKSLNDKELLLSSMKESEVLEPIRDRGTYMLSIVHDIIRE